MAVGWLAGRLRCCPPIGGGAEGPGPMVCPICEPTDEDVSDLRLMGKLRKTASGRDLACLCKSNVTPLGSKSVSFHNILELPKHASQSISSVQSKGYENVHNTVEGNSDEEGMDENLGEPDYMNTTPEGSAIGSRALEESRKRERRALY